MNCNIHKECEHKFWELDHECDDHLEDWYRCKNCGYKSWFYPREVEELSENTFVILTDEV